MGILTTCSVRRISRGPLLERPGALSPPGAKRATAPSTFRGVCGGAPPLRMAEDLRVTEARSLAKRRHRARQAKPHPRLRGAGVPGGIYQDERMASKAVASRDRGALNYRPA
jgi:hypothetical protein